MPCRRFASLELIFAFLSNGDSEYHFFLQNIHAIPSICIHVREIA